MTQKRVVVDSSGWIEIFTNSDQTEHFLALMADERELVVPAITIIEVYKWVLREHGEAQAIQAAAVMQCAQVVDLDSRLALAAAQLSHALQTRAICPSFILCINHIMPPPPSPIPASPSPSRKAFGNP